MFTREEPLSAVHSVSLYESEFVQRSEKFQDELRQLPPTTNQQEENNSFHRTVKFWVAICVLLVLLGGILVTVIFTSSGDGAIDHFQDVIPEIPPDLSPIDDSSGIPSPSARPETPTDQSNGHTNLPLEAPVYGPPSAEECEAVSNGESLTAHKENHLRYSFEVTLDLALAENIGHNDVVQELKEKMQTILMPIVIGCNTVTIRRNMLDLPIEAKVKHQRQLILAPHSIAGAQVVAVEMGHTVCTTSDYPNCIVVVINVDFYLRGPENREDYLMDTISSVFGPEEGIIEILEMSNSLVGLVIQSVESKAEASPPSSLPTMQPSTKPTSSPTANPATTAPSIWPTTDEPSKFPTSSPSTLPTTVSSLTPSAIPTVADSSSPTSGPSPRPTTEEPTRAPTPAPTKAPSTVPSKDPSATPSATPSAVPSKILSAVPSRVPSKVPSTGPSRAPSRMPTKVPSKVPTNAPSTMPTFKPSYSPSILPTITRSANPSFAPVTWPTTEEPTRVPSSAPTKVPTVAPSSEPSNIPTSNPTSAPTVTPSLPPTPGPSGSPSSGPTITPSLLPTSIPSLPPTPAPTFLPSLPPSVAPTPTPTTSPPTMAPTVAPTPTPTTSSPTMAPSMHPTRAPTMDPSRMPTPYPTKVPSESPSTSTSPTLGRAIRISCAGDSLTLGTFGGQPRDVPYPFQLQQMLGEKFEVHNYGKNSVTAIRGLSYSYVNRWQFHASLNVKPDIYLLMLGTNDVKYWGSHGQNFGMDLEWIVSQVRNIPVEPPPRIVVAIPPWVKTDVYGIRNDLLVSGVQPGIRNIATVENLQLVDMYSVTYNQADGYLGDGLHLNKRGNGLLAAAWKLAVECNQNGICEAGESSVTCPSDCR